MTVFVRAGFEVRPGCQSAFERTATALRDLAQKEPGVLGYEWCYDDDSCRYLAMEHFASSAAMLTHARLAEDLLRQLAEHSEMVVMELHGRVTPELRATVERMPNALTIFETAPFNP